MKIFLIIIIILLSCLFALAAAITALKLFSTYKYYKKKNKKLSIDLLSDKNFLVDIALTAISILILVLLILCIGKYNSVKSASAKADEIVAESVIKPETPSFAPKSMTSTDPNNWGIKWDIIADGKITDTYKRDRAIKFDSPDRYFTLPGVSAFRGDNYRSGATYGTAQVNEKKIDTVWNVPTGALTNSDGDGAWTGSGWTGQPLVVKWDKETRAIMNIFPDAPEDLVEVIYATLDGHIYFLNLEDGSYTRDPINIGMAFKGAGSLDPRGYPLLYVGSGDATADGKRPRMFIISLIDGEILFEYGSDDEFALRGDNNRWTAYDSSPLIDAETDTLIWPGENGILYTIKLNTKYDRNAGTITVSPEETVKTRYTTSRSSDEAYWLGYECSASIIENYIYLSENGGMFYCVDLNTMELVWAQNTKDDSNSSSVTEFDPASGQGYIYTAPSLHWTADPGRHGEISIYKLNAANGDIEWSRSYSCNTVPGVSGGVQATPLLGKKGTSLEGLIIYPIARTPNRYDGLLVALDTETGEEVWRMDMDKYTWSSPVAVYGDDGTGYVILCDSDGNVFMLDGKTGEELDTSSVGWLVEASPVVYEDMIVVGTRGSKIYCLKVR